MVVVVVIGSMLEVEDDGWVVEAIGAEVVVKRAVVVDADGTTVVEVDAGCVVAGAVVVDSGVVVVVVGRTDEVGGVVLTAVVVDNDSAIPLISADFALSFDDVS